MEIQQEKSLGNNHIRFSSAKLYDHTTPEFYENVGKNFVLYGLNNDYPDYLTYLYNRCGLHRAIINGKVRFIGGQGWTIKEEFKNDQKVSNFIANPNKEDSLNELTYKALLDDKIFGGYYLKLLFVGGNLEGVYHLPYEQVRLGVDGRFYVSKKWTKNQSTNRTFKPKKDILPVDVKDYAEFNPTNKTGVQIAYFPSYRPEFRGYPLPEYHATIVDIESDIEISNFHLNNVKTGFAAGTMVTFFQDVADDKIKQETENGFKGKFAETNNGGEIILCWAGLSGKKPEIESLRGNDLDKRFESLQKNVQDRIVMGHECVNGMLFGIKTEGQLGGRSELDLAWKMFNLNYVEPNQLKLERDFNWILKSCGMLPVLKIKPLKGLGIEITETMLNNALTKEEMRKIIEDELNIGLDLSLTIAPEPTKLSNQDFNVKLLGAFSKIGLSADDFEFATDEEILLKYITDNKIKDLDIEKAEKELKIDVKKALESLSKSNKLVGVNSGTATAPRYEIKDIQQPENLIEFETKWRYAWVDPTQASDIDNSRSFCKQMLALNKLYTKEEIDNLNNDMTEFNTDVWKYRGGWYNTGEVNLPQCRHFWKQEIVRKK